MKTKNPNASNIASRKTEAELYKFYTQGKGDTSKVGSKDDLIHVCKDVNYNTRKQ